MTTDVANPALKPQNSALEKQASQPDYINPIRLAAGDQKRQRSQSRTALAGSSVL
jgi:hypothetical protein